MRRRYIALTTFLVSIVFLGLYFNFKNRSFIPGEHLQDYYLLGLLLIHAVIMRLVYVVKDDENKNILTALNVFIMLVYIILFAYSVIFS